MARGRPGTARPYSRADGLWRGRGGGSLARDRRSAFDHCRHPRSALFLLPAPGLANGRARGAAGRVDVRPQQCAPVRSGAGRADARRIVPRSCDRFGGKRGNALAGIRHALPAQRIPQARVCHRHCLGARLADARPQFAGGGADLCRVVRDFPAVDDAAQPGRHLALRRCVVRDGPARRGAGAADGSAGGNRSRGTHRNLFPLRQRAPPDRFLLRWRNRLRSGRSRRTHAAGGRLDW